MYEIDERISSTPRADVDSVMGVSTADALRRTCRSRLLLAYLRDEPGEQREDVQHSFPHGERHVYPFAQCAAAKRSASLRSRIILASINQEWGQPTKVCEYGGDERITRVMICAIALCHHGKVAQAQIGVAFLQARQAVV